MFHLFTDGALRHTQFLRRARKAAVPGGHFEGLQIG
jgi:hypothetical protein